MKHFFPLKFLVLVYSFLFHVPLYLMLSLPNSFTYILIKIVLGCWLILTISQGNSRYPNITLGAFLGLTGIFLTFRWFVTTSPFDLLFSLVFIVLYIGKFRQIDSIMESANRI